MLALAIIPKQHLLDETSFSSCYLDRDGHLLRLALADDDRYRVFVPLKDISPQFVEMTLLHEDRFYHEHPGFNAISLAQVGVARIAHAVDRLGLAPWLDHEVEALSAGWQRRLALTRVLIADAPIVLLDEPAAGLDVSGRRDLLRLVRGFASEGRAVLVTSHILPELEELADRFGIIRSGQWLSVREGQPFFTRSELRAGFSQGFWRLECSEPTVACASLGVERAQLEPDGERIRLVASSRDDAASLVEQLMRAGHKIYHLEAGGRSLDDVTLAALDDISHP